MPGQAPLYVVLSDIEHLTHLGGETACNDHLNVLLRLSELVCSSIGVFCRSSGPHRAFRCPTGQPQAWRDCSHTVATKTAAIRRCRANHTHHGAMRVPLIVGYRGHSGGVPTLRYGTHSTNHKTTRRSHIPPRQSTTPSSPRFRPFTPTWAVLLPFPCPQPQLHAPSPCSTPYVCASAPPPPLFLSAG